MLSARIITLVLILVFTISSGSSAQTQPGAEEILRNVRETYRKMKTYQFEYRISAEHRTQREELISESKQQAAGTVWIASWDRSRTEAKDSNNHVVRIVDGRITWSYMPALKAYTRREADADGNPPKPEGFDYNAGEAIGYLRNYSSLGSTPPRSTTNYTFNFVGAQPGRWRVWAVDAEGRQGAKSEWWEFSYTR